MPKLFVISDVHGFYNEMKRALDDAGFDPENENHWLIGCGDYFDRGHQPAQVMRYLKGLPRKILVRGNHELLFKECCDRGFWLGHDLQNGTMDTICELGGEKYGHSFDECCVIAQQRVKLFFDSMVNYFETEHYIFVHSFIPLKNLDGLPMYYTRNRKFEFNPDWRNAHTSEWEAATWGNPFDLAKQGLNQTGKIMIHGHWSNSYYWAFQEGRSEYGEDAKWDICEHDNCIGLDATTARSGKVNILVLEDNFMEK